MAILNGTPMGPGFLMFFNNEDVSPRFKGFERVTIYEDVPEDDEEIIEIISAILTSGALN